MYYAMLLMSLKKLYGTRSTFVKTDPKSSHTLGVASLWYARPGSEDPKAILGFSAGSCLLALP